MRSTTATAIAVAALLGLPGTASAATVAAGLPDHADVLLDAKPGEQNNVTLRVVDGRYVFTDSGAPLDAAGDCVSEDPNRVTCPANGQGHPALALGDGDDTVDAAIETTGDPRTGPSLQVSGGDGADRMTASGYSVHVSGGAGPDTITVSDTLTAFIDGYEDADVITSNAFQSNITGGEGDDTLTGTDATEAFDHVDGGPGNDRIDGRGGGDTLRGDEGADTIDGGAGPDIIEGGADNDDLRGGTHGDTLNGGLGDDTLEGGGGDTYHFNQPPEWLAVQGQFIDRLDGGPGADTMSGGDGDFDQVLYAGRRAPVLASLDGLRNDGELGERDLIGTDIETLIGGESDDTLRGSASGNYLDGGAGDDTVDGGGGYHDVAYGGAGNDTIVTLDGGIEGRRGIGGPMGPFPWDDAVRCDENASERGVDTAIVDPTDRGENSQLATGGCETVFFAPAPQTIPVVRGAVSVPVTCGAGPPGSCKGQAVVEQYLPAKRGQASKRRVIGTSSFKARVAKRSKLRVKLNATGRKAVSRKGRVSAVRVAYRLKRQRR